MGIVEIYKSGSSKVLKADIPAGERMPTHYASSEAFVVVTKGRAEVIFSDHEQYLQSGSTLTIPQRKPHTLHILEDFEALIILEGKAKLEYANQAAKYAMNNS